MPQSFADYDSEYLSARRKGLSCLPTSNTGRRHQQQPSASTTIRLSPLHHEVSQRGETYHRDESSSSAVTSAATSRSSTATSMSSHPGQGHTSVKEASLKAQEIQPTSEIALWAHQTHVTQGRSYWWCQGCFPPEVAQPLHIPKAVEKVVTGRRVRINEPSHCYDI